MDKPVLPKDLSLPPELIRLLSGNIGIRPERVQEMLESTNLPELLSRFREQALEEVFSGKFVGETVSHDLSEFLSQPLERLEEIFWEELSDVIRERSYSHRDVSDSLDAYLSQTMTTPDATYTTLISYLALLEMGMTSLPYQVVELTERAARSGYQELLSQIFSQALLTDLRLSELLPLVRTRSVEERELILSAASDGVLRDYITVGSWPGRGRRRLRVEISEERALGARLDVLGVVLQALEGGEVRLTESISRLLEVGLRDGLITGEEAELVRYLLSSDA